MFDQNNNDNIQTISDYTNNQIITPIPYIFHPLKNNNKSILIATHNIQGMNNITKFQQWIQFCHDSQLDIISITETKLASSTHNNFKFLNSHYKIFFANTTSISKKKQEASMGTAIAVKNSLCPYIHNIQTFEGYGIAIDLFFPGNQWYRIISVYNPCNDNNAREFLNQKIQQWIQNANTLKIETIVLGDFNYTLDYKQFKILSTIQASSLISILKQFNITIPTWNRAQSSSQIDDI